MLYSAAEFVVYISKVGKICNFFGRKVIIKMCFTMRSFKVEISRIYRNVAMSIMKIFWLKTIRPLNNKATILAEQNLPG